MFLQFNRLQILERKKKIHPFRVVCMLLRIYIYIGFLLLLFALLYGLLFENRKRTHGCKCSKSLFYALVVPFFCPFELLICLFANRGQIGVIPASQNTQKVAFLPFWFPKTRGKHFLGLTKSRFWGFVEACTA